MSDFSLTAHQGETIRWRIIATKTLDDGTVQNIDLTLANTKLAAVGRLAPGDAPLFTRDYQEGGGAPNGGITVPAPGQAATNVAEIKIDPNDAGVGALTKTSYILVNVTLTEPDGTDTVVSSGVVKLRVP